jgi:hypothetical protein
MRNQIIKVTVQREDRLHAINELCGAVHVLAKALNQAPNLTIENCNIASTGSSPAISIDTEDEVTRTEIVELED